jgi:hypothetical protein
VSYDLAVFTSDRPELPAAPDGVEIDGPFEADDEDAPPAVAAALLTVRWTVQLSGAALDLARAIADSGRGVVYDPQEDRIVWPADPAVLRAVQPRRDGATIKLEWLFARRLSSTDAHRLLAVLRAAMPEAVPVRFGDHEPMQGRLERDGDAAFAALWDGTSSPFWSGRAPVEHGFVHLRRGFGAALSPAEREALIPVVAGRKATEADELTLHFQANVDDRWIDAIVRLFAGVASDLGAFFAGAFHSKRAAVINGRYWLGITPDPLWLTWVGAEYRAASGLGPLLRAAARPDDFRAIKRGRPPWPSELVRRGDQLDQERAASVIPDLS